MIPSRHSTPARIIGSVLALCLFGAPAHAAPTWLEEAKGLHEQAQARFDTADYLGAIESWTAAYQTLPKTGDSGRMRPFILYNIATAREKAYETTDDVAHLRRARVLLETFERSIDELYADPEQRATERARVQDRLVGLEEKIRTHEARTTPEPEPESEPEPGPEPQAETELGAPSEPPDRPPEGRALVIGGAVLTALGGAAAIMTFTAVGIGAAANDVDDLRDDTPQDKQAREEQFERGRISNPIAIAGAVATPLLLAGGIALLVVGKKRQRARTAWTPAIAPGAASLTWTLHF